MSDRRSFSRPSRRVSPVETERRPTTLPPLPETAVTVEVMSVYPLTTPLDLRLAQEFSKFGPPKWGHHHWTVGVVTPTRKRPGMRQRKSSIPHLHPAEILAEHLEEQFTPHSPSNTPEVASHHAQVVHQVQEFLTTLAGKSPLHHMVAEHNRDRRTDGVLLDIEKAFDLVWHPGLLYKLLRKTQIPPALVWYRRSWKVAASSQ
ncbi:hypothetical protein EVAR_88133_1 [Eumeta japonica]|uniref:Reverse transcriptase domain-containing protein n=1 Tax=Eumeta variegata TaxID=151549 RepID=A0A4C1WSF9_EUMVA|nr:hypothetical protein EVAR_88133_1 [Eumeta japonica]